MYRQIASFIGSWQTRADDTWGNAAFMGIALLFVSYAQTLMEPRTIFMEGFVPDARWLTIVVFWCGLVLTCPVRLRVPLNARLWRWALPLAVAALWTSRTVAVSCVLATGVAALCWSNHALAERLRSRLYAATWGWTLATLAGNIYQHIEARVWTATPLTFALKGTLQLLGVQTNAAGDQIAMHTHELTTLVLPSFDKFGGTYLAETMACLLTLCSLLAFPTKRVVYAVATLAGYTLLRAAWMLVNLAGRPTPTWWLEDQLLQTFAPFAVICFWLLLAPQAEPDDVRTQQTCRQPLLPLAGGLVGLLLLLCGWYYTDPGTRKHGVVVMDESHCQWEQSTTPIDTEWFGSRTVYNYYNFAEALSHYYPTRINNGALDEAALADASVLILKTPTKPYDDVSLGAIRRFVARGGGLWLIGDHTDAFGMSTYLNSIARPYGLQFRDDAYAEPPGRRNLWLSGPYSHPALRRLPLFLFYTGCSLGSGWLDNDVIAAGRELVDPPDYSAGTFFGDLVPVLSDRVANVTMATEVQRGNGRIALWSDSTLFSNFSIFVPGKMEVALYTIDWLNRENSALNMRLILLVAGAALLLVSVRFLRVESLLLVGLTAVCAMPPLLSAWSAWKFPLPQPNVPFETMAFYEPELTQHLPIAITNDEPTPLGYLSTFVAIQRVGKRPMVSSEAAGIGGARQAVYIPTSKDLSASERERLLSWVRQGGNLYVLDGGLSSKRQLNQLAGAAGAAILPFDKLTAEQALKSKTMLVFVNGDIDAQIDVSFNGKAIGRQIVSGYIQGGMPLLLDAANSQPIAAELPLGKGHLILTTTLFMFSDQSLGDVKAIPTDQQLAVYQLLFQWYGKGRNYNKAIEIRPLQQAAAGGK